MFKYSVLCPADISGIIKNILKMWPHIIGNGTISTESARTNRYDKHGILTEDLDMRKIIHLSQQ